MEYGPEFTAFWRVFPHRPGTRDKMEADMLWRGKLPMKNKSKITPSMWPRIHEGALAQSELYGNDQYRWNVCRWMRAGAWESTIEEKEQQDMEMADEETKHQRILEFNRAYRKWCHSCPRGPGEPKHTVEEYRAHLEAVAQRQQGAQLRLVGES